MLSLLLSLSLLLPTTVPPTEPGNDPRALAPPPVHRHHPAKLRTQYTVQANDTLWSIALKFQHSHKIHGWHHLFLMNADRVLNPHRIHVGQRLRLKGKLLKPRPIPKPRPTLRPRVEPQPRPSRQVQSNCRGIAVSSAEDNIIERESGWNPSADNPTSSAFGLGQLTYENRARYLGSALADTTDCALQLQAFRSYVRDHYGSAEAAWSFWKSHSWY